MGQLIIPQNHVSLTCEQDLNDICAPLFKPYHLNHFQYGRVYHSGEMVCLINNRAFVEHWTKNELKPVSSIKPHQQDKKSYFVVWEGVVPESYLKFARDMFNITQGVSIVHRHEHYYELFAFGAPAENRQAFDFYLNHKELLLQFTMYFKEKAKPLIRQAERDMLMLPSHMQDNNCAKMLWDPQQKQSTRPAQFPTKRYYVSYRSQDYYLTQAELLCFQWLCQGKTVKQVALKLNISNRTVESYINRVKARLKCYSTSQILELIQENF